MEREGRALDNKHCPRCGLRSDAAAEYCDCGYNFAIGDGTAKVTPLSPGEIVGVSSGQPYAAGCVGETVMEILVLAVGGLLYLAGVRLDIAAVAVVFICAGILVCVLWRRRRSAHG